jgi:hypothetical protein
LRRLRAAPRRRLAGDETGWHRGGAVDWRLTAFEATAAALLLERHRWRAEAVDLVQGLAYVACRGVSVTGHPRVATFGRPGAAEAGLRAHGHGLRGGGRAALARTLRRRGHAMTAPEAKPGPVGRRGRRGGPERAG